MKPGRISKELEDISKNGIAGAIVELKDGNLAKWEVTVLGPEKSPYEGGKFHILVDFSDNYPFKPPKINFVTKVFHPNIKKDTGEICMKEIEDAWKPILNARWLIEYLIKLLREPLFSSPLDQDVIDSHINGTFETKAKEFTKAWAS